jgi:hypothetical protein
VTKKSAADFRGAGRSGRLSVSRYSKHAADLSLADKDGKQVKKYEDEHESDGHCWLPG